MNHIPRLNLIHLISKPNRTPTPQHHDRVFVLVSLKTGVAARFNFKVPNLELSLFAIHQNSPRHLHPGPRLIFVSIHRDRWPRVVTAPVDHGKVTITFTVSPAFIRS